MLKKPSDFEKIIGVVFKNKALLITALTHRSHSIEGTQSEHNERLEFLGDAVLEVLVTQYLFYKFTEEPEGFLTSLRAATVKTESLAKEARRLGYGDYIIMSKGEEMTGGRDRTYILANTFEAVIGAIYADQGLEAAKAFLEKELFYKVKEIVDKRLDIDAKSQLQEIAQDQIGVTPRYEVTSADGPDHNKTFRMRAIIGKVRCGIGQGKNKQSAEQVAAKNTLLKWKDYKAKILN